MKIFVPKIGEEVEFPDGTPVEEIERSLNESFYTSEEPIHPTTFKDREAYRVDKGQSVVDVGKSFARAMRGEITDQEALDFKNIRMARFTPENDARFDAANTAEKFIGAGTELAPYMLSSSLEGFKYGELFGASVAAAALVGGAAGPQIGLPEEIITVPVAYYGGKAIGQAYGAWMNAADVEGGSLYGELIDAKLDPKTARAWAAPAGTIIGAIELFQVGHLFNKFLPAGFKYSRKGAAEFIKRIAVSKVSNEAADKLLASGEQLLAKAVTPFSKLRDKATKNVLGRATGTGARVAGKVAMTTVTEVAEEETQQAVELFAESAAHFQQALAKDQGYAGPDFETVKQEMKQTLVSSLYGFPLLGLPGAAWSEVRSRSGYRRAVTSERGVESLQMSLLPVVEEAAKYEDFKTFMDSANITIDEQSIQKLGFDNYPSMMQSAFAASRGMKRLADLQTRFDELLDQEDIVPGSEGDIKLIRENLPEVMSLYEQATREAYETSRAVVASGDLPKMMKLGFREDFKTEDSVPRHAAASAISKLFEEERLKDPKTRDLPVMVWAGVSGAGKSTVTKRFNIALDDFALVKDSNIPTLKSAQRIIDAALKEGHKVRYVLIDRDPIEAFKDGVYGRFIRDKKEGDPPRIVPVNVHLHNAKARDAASDIEDFYKDNPNVEFSVIFNRPGKRAEIGTIAEIKPLEYTLNEAGEQIKAFLKERYDNGEINEAEYKAFLGQKKPGSAKDSQGRGEGSQPGKIADEERVPGSVKPPTEEPPSESGKDQPKPPEKDLTKQGRVNKLVSEQKSLLKQIDLLEEQRRLLEGQGRATTQVEKKLTKLESKYNAAEAEIAELLTDETVKVQETQDIEIQAGEQIRSVQASIREGKIQSREEVEAAQGTIINLIESAGLEAEDRAKFLRSVKNVKTEEDLARAIPEIAERLEQLGGKAARRSLKAKIRKELRDTKVTKQAGKPVGKFTPTIQKILDFGRQAIRMTKDEASAQIVANLLEVGDKIPPPELAIQNRILSMVIGLETATTEELQKTLDLIQSLKTTGRAATLIKNAARFDVIDEAVGKFVTIITGGQGVAPSVQTQGAVDADKSMAWINSTFGRTFLAWDDMLDILSQKDKESKPGQSFVSKFGDVLNETNAEKRGLREAHQAIGNMAEKAFGIDRKKLAKKLQEDSREDNLGIFRFGDGSVQELRFTRAEARKRWMELQDPTLEETFFSEEGMAYTQEISDAIDKYLTKEDKAFAQAQLDWYRQYYNGVNEVYRDVYGVDLPFNEKYSPIKRGDIDRDKSEGFGEFIQEVRARAAVTSGSLKSRTDNILTIEKRGDIAVLLQHVSEMERFKNWVYKVRDLNSVFGNSTVRAAIIENYGSGMLGTVELFLKKFTRTGADRASVVNWIDQLRVNYTRSVLAIKPKIALQQTIGFIAYADAMPVKDFVAGVSDFWRDPAGNAAVLMQSELMKDRGANIDRDIRDAVRSDAYRAFRQGENFLNTLMTNVQLGDRWAIFVGGWALYKYERGQGKTHEEALASFEKFTTRTQQSGDISEQSLIQQAGSFAKLFTMFKSSQNQYLRREVMAVRNLLSGRLTPAEAAKTLAIYHFILPMLFQWVANFGEWDEEDEARAAILGSLNGLFVVGDMLERIVRVALGDKDFKTIIPIYSSGDDIVRMIKSVKEDDVSLENVLESAGHFADAAGALTGAPLKTIVDMIGSLAEIHEQDYRHAIGSALGWSDYVLENKEEPAGKFKRL